jgi:ethanolamine utilization protein EutA (predicted chaperonin)
MAIDIFSEEVPVNLEENTLQVKNIIADMLSFATSLVVDNEPAYKKMTSLYSQARAWKKCVEEKRKAMTEPLRKQTASINDKAKELTDPLDGVISLANAKATSYQRLLEQKRLEDEAKLRAAADLFDAADEVYVPALEKVIRGDGASAVTKVEKRFRLVDISKVPAKYLMIDEKKLIQDIKLGLNQIEGIDIYEETITSLRVRS